MCHVATCHEHLLRVRHCGECWWQTRHSLCPCKGWRNNQISRCVGAGENTWPESHREGRLLKTEFLAKLKQGKDAQVPVLKVPTWRLTDGWTRNPLPTNSTLAHPPLGTLLRVFFSITTSPPTCLLVFCLSQHLMGASPASKAGCLRTVMLKT